jgi:branched-chain amino acid aminotransferase
VTAAAGFFAAVNGEVLPAGQARVSVLDTGFTFGDSVYETLRTYGGRPFHMDRHLARLRSSAGRLGIPVPGDADFVRDVDAVLARAGNPESYLRLMVTRGVGDVSYHFDRVHGPTRVVIVKPYEPLPERFYAEGAAVILASVRRNSPRALDPAIKSGNLINNILAVREAQAAGALEPILLNDDGDIAEGASANVFIVKGGAVLTPPLRAGILPGVTRELILEIGRGLGIPMHEETLRVPDLLGADEAFITSTLKEAVPVRTVDGNAVGEGRPGPVTLRLLQAYREYARAR